MRDIVEKCGKPGCGAQRQVGNPCTDGDCPQRYVTAAEYRTLQYDRDAVVKMKLVADATISALRQQVEKARAQGRDEGLEEAAKVARDRYHGHSKSFGTTRAANYEHASKRISAAIRALKSGEGV